MSTHFEDEGKKESTQAEVADSGGLGEKVNEEK